MFVNSFRNLFFIIFQIFCKINTFYIFLILGSATSFHFHLILRIFIVLYCRIKYNKKRGKRKKISNTRDGNNMEFIMNNTDTIIFIMEIIGTIAFASSGALTAMKQNMDIFGINVLGIITAVGGGCMRDLLIDRTPPVMFIRPIYALVAMITCNLLFLIFYWNKKLLTNSFMFVYERLMLILDAIGLGIFTVVGVSVGMSSAYHSSLFLTVFLGVITGVGGGVLRDVLAAQKPYILVKHVYACASLLGALVCALLWFLGSIPAMFIGAAVVIIIRLMAMKFRWNLPKLDIEE